MSEVRIRPLERGDLDRLLVLLGELNATGNASDPRYVLADDWREQMRALMLDQWFGRFHPFPIGFAAVVDGVVVGYVQGDVVQSVPVLERPPTVRIGNLWVEPGHRRKGIASELVRTYCAAARSKGFPWIEVGTLTKDPRATGFWKAAGFDDWRVILLSS